MVPPHPSSLSLRNVVYTSVFKNHAVFIALSRWVSVSMSTSGSIGDIAKFSSVPLFLIDLQFKCDRLRGKAFILVDFTHWPYSLEIFCWLYAVLDMSVEWFLLVVVRLFGSLSVLLWLSSLSVLSVSILSNIWFWFLGIWSFSFMMQDDEFCLLSIVLLSISV